jgi:hypothetical protein
VDDLAGRRRLESLARSGKVFFLVTEDPVRYRIDVYAGEHPPEVLNREFESLGGTFLLEAPTGRVVVSGCDPPLALPADSFTPLDVGVGKYLLTAMGRRPFNAALYAEDMSQVAGPGDWKFVQLVDRLGILGCLPLVVTIMCAIVTKWRWLLWCLLPVLAISWLPYLVLKSTRRYKTVQALAADRERARPHYILTLMPTDQEGLAGGFVRV